MGGGWGPQAESASRGKERGGLEKGKRGGSYGKRTDSVTKARRLHGRGGVNGKEKSGMKLKREGSEGRERVTDTQGGKWESKPKECRIEAGI